MPLLQIENLKTFYPRSGKLFGAAPEPLRAVDDVSFDVEEGTTVGLVGGSGSGKSTVSKTVLKLVPHTDGRVLLDGEDILPLPESEFRPRRRDLQMVFQDPYSSLNPRMTVADILAEPVDLHLSLPASERRDLCASLLEKVQLPADSLSRFPHQFSGGQRQRIGIARALTTNPRFLILDEPVSALDVSVQAEVLDLLKNLQDERGLTYLFISHDMGVIDHMSDRVVVMHEGKVVESGTVDEVCLNPQHPYSQKLLAAALGRPNAAAS